MHAAVGRNGHHLVRITKVRAKDGTPETFRSALPWLHLIGVSSGEMAPALNVLRVLMQSKGVSVNTVSRLNRDWAQEPGGRVDTALDDGPIAYIWADGVHSGLRVEDHKFCALVVVGVTARCKKRFPDH